MYYVERGGRSERTFHLREPRTQWQTVLSWLEKTRILSILQRSKIKMRMRSDHVNDALELLSSGNEEVSLARTI